MTCVELFKVREWCVAPRSSWSTKCGSIGRISYVFSTKNVYPIDRRYLLPEEPFLCLFSPFFFVSWDLKKTYFSQINLSLIITCLLVMVKLLFSAYIIYFSLNRQLRTYLRVCCFRLKKIMRIVVFAFSIVLLYWNNFAWNWKCVKIYCRRIH